MGIAPDDDFEPDGWEEATADARTRIRSSVQPLTWDDPTTEDEEGKCTRAFDASKVLSELEEATATRSFDASQVLAELEEGNCTRSFDASKVLSELEHLVKPEQPPSGMREVAPPGFGKVRARGVREDRHSEPPPQSGLRAWGPAKGEPTPVVGQEFMSSLAALEAEAGSEIAGLGDDFGSEVTFGGVKVEESSLSPEESAAIAAVVAMEEAPELEDHCAELIDQDALPCILIDPRSIGELALDHRAGFLLSLIDGVSSVHDILDVCGMPQMEALEILFHLQKSHVISIDRV